MQTCRRFFSPALTKNGFESRKIKKLIAKIALKMKIDKKNYSAFKENDSLKDKRLQELFLMEPLRTRARSYSRGMGDRHLKI